MVIAAGARFKRGAISGSSTTLASNCLQPRILHPGDRGAQIGVQLFDIVLRVRQEIAEFVVALGGGNDLLERQFLLAVVELHAAANADHVVALKRLRDGVEIVPHLRGNRAGAVAQAQFQPGFAAARRSANLFFADEKERSDQSGRPQDR